MRRALVTGVLLLATLGVVQADSGGTAQTVVAGNMNDGPYSDANAIGSVPVNTIVTVLSRQGGWYKVRLPTGQTGWLPMTDLRLGNAGSGGTNAPKSSGSHGFFSLFESGRSGASGTTATTGVRGLNTGDIANAKPDPAAVTELDQWMAKPPVAVSFAGELKLKADKLDYLPKAKP